MADIFSGDAARAHRFQPFFPKGEPHSKLLGENGEKNTEHKGLPTAAGFSFRKKIYQHRPQTAFQLAKAEICGAQVNAKETDQWACNINAVGCVLL